MSARAPAEREAGEGPEYRPALAIDDAIAGGMIWIHMGRRILRSEVAACGAPVWIWTGGPFNPDYDICPGCIEAAGYDPRPGRTVDVGNGRQGVLI